MTASHATPPLPVLIVEDDPWLLRDLARMVSAMPSLKLAGAVATAREARLFIQSRLSIGLMLVDLGLPDGDGMALIRLLRDTSPHARVLVLTVFDDEMHVVSALAAGAHGYVLKESDAATLERALKDVLAGDAPLSPRIARYLLRRFERTPQSVVAGDERLSSREAEVLTLVAHGFSAGEIAKRLGLSLHTVNTHLRNTYGKLAVNNRVQAVNRARDSGQIDA
ncbi:response regulator [Roseateles cellulosilyticus]|uniref:Response regulator transcription factor n=1 Tax=Pelomonas cellulosilytica TaxID=2906762 RepID=A0ABS8XJI8_9BURK|nr:response regulator transcription factor [Pelomonas sp. P8]MCE4553031.1 response regulator transcription factor [Pelomonas sp. P8]